tara:strand:- start:854 stop:1279 length:426 start_codon:yes stop_codon:yes gene_type:complete
MVWIPPKSPFNLIQESLWENPWQLLVACIFCNQTKRVCAEPILWDFFEKYPTPECAASADIDELIEMLSPLGLQKRRAYTLIRFSREFVEKEWKLPRDLYGIGKYGTDAWQIFCQGSWQEVSPSDHALNDYHRFLEERSHA